MSDRFEKRALATCRGHLILIMKSCLEIFTYNSAILSYSENIFHKFVTFICLHAKLSILEHNTPQLSNSGSYAKNTKLITCVFGVSILFKTYDDVSCVFIYLFANR